MNFGSEIQLASLPDASKVVLTFAAIYVIYSFGLVIYNIYFHPLSKFPGPASRAAAAWFDLLPLMRGSQVWDEKALHDEYGPVVRMGPNSLSFTSGQAWKDIAGTRAGKKQMQKDPEFYIAKLRDAADIISADDVDHSRFRKLLSHAFSDSAIREQEPLVTQYFDLLIEKLKHQIEGPAQGKIDIMSWYNFTTFDIIGDLAFGEPFYALENGEYHYWIRNIFASIKYGRFVRFAFEYPILKYMFFALYKLVPSFGEARKMQVEYTNNRVDKRLNAKTERKDFMDYILRYNDERGMTNLEIKNNSGILIVAGSETTATLLSGATYYLMRNPRVWNKLKDEVRGAFVAEDEINISSTAPGKLPYLHAVLEESLRRYPPVPTRLPRQTPKGGDYIDGFFVPGGVSVGVTQYAAHHVTSNWHNPEAFAPERWLDNPPEEYKNDDRTASQPFSTGPRNCLGKNLAYVEMRSILARIVWYFDMELCEESKDWTNQNAYLLWEKPPLWVRLKMRDSKVLA